MQGRELVVFRIEGVELAEPTGELLEQALPRPDEPLERSLGLLAL
jgi:hypothetical protein